MNTLKKIAQEFQLIDGSATWLLVQMNDALIELDQAEDRCSTDSSREATENLDQCVERIKNLLARCKMELKNCEDFSKKYNIP